MIETAGFIAVGFIVVHAMWCLLCPRVSDGVLGKVLYLLLSLAAFSYLSSPTPVAQSALNLSFAAIAARHLWMKTYWPTVKHAIMRFFHGYGKR